MEEIRWPRKELKWIPQEKCKQVWPSWAWRDNVKEAMAAGDLTEEVCYRRKSVNWGWRNGGSCKVIRIYIYIYIYIPLLTPWSRDLF
jgi:hypothetical protein